MSGLDKKLEKIEYQLSVILGETNSKASPNGQIEEINLYELWCVIAQGKKLILGCTLIFLVAAVAYAMTLPNIYKSEALLVPADGGSNKGLIGQFGGLATLAGVNISGGSDKSSLAIEVLKSREFIEYFVVKHELTAPLIASVGWDSSADELIYSSAMYDGKRWLVGEGGMPTQQDVIAFFLEKLNVSTDGLSGFVSISFESVSPSLSKHIVDQLVEDINLVLKERDVAEATRSIEYLSAQLKETPIKDMHVIFYELIEKQIKTIMLAEVREEYVFKTIDRAVAAESKFKPSRDMFMVLGAGLGFMLGLLIVFVRLFVSGGVSRRT